MTKAKLYPIIYSVGQVTITSEMTSRPDVSHPSWLPTYLQDFNAIELNRVGQQLGSGNEHYVFQYFATPEANTSSGYILKVPRVEERNSTKRWLSPEQLYQEYTILQQYFGSMVAESHIVSSPHAENSRYCIVQREVKNLEPLTRDHLRQNPTLLEQFATLIYQNHLMYQQTGYYLPLLGHDGAVSTLHGQPELTNVVVEGTGENARLCIVDLGRITANPLLHAEKRKEFDTQHPTQHTPFEMWLMHPLFDLAASVREGIAILSNEAALKAYFEGEIKKYLHEESQS